MPSRKVPLLDLRAQNGAIREELLAVIERVVDSQAFILGEEVRLLERELAAYNGAAHAIACASGSDALFLALLGAGIQPGDEVLTTPFTFFATAGAVSRLGAVPVFVDIDPGTFNIDPQKLAEALRRHPHARAVVVVHLYGGCADMDAILPAARAAGCVVIEDGAQSIGAEYKGRRAQGIGDIGCVSFYPTKNLGAMGDAGLLTTNDAETARKLAALRVHGSFERYRHEWIGINSRLDTMQAAVLRVKLRSLDAWTAARQRNAARYRSLMAGLPVGLPEEAPYQTRHVYNQFVIRSAQRDQLRAYLGEHGIGSEVYYPIPLHLQPCYLDLGYREGAFPVAEQACREVLALPIAEHLAEEDLQYVAEAIARFERG